MILYISPKFGERADSVKLIEAARRQGIRTETLANSWHQSALPNEQIAFYGEHAFCEFLAQELGYNLSQNSLDWVSRLPHFFVKRSIQCMTLKEAVKIENTTQSILERRLLEPADDPCFKAAIYDKFPAVPQNTPVLLSNHHQWKVKYRFIIINGKIASWCCYQLETTINQPVIWSMRYTADGTDAHSFLQAALTHYNTAPACVIDVGYIDHIGWAIKNTYPVWSSQLLGCGAPKFLEALFVSCQKIKP